MNKLLWIFQILITLVLGLFGFQKIVVSIPDLIAQGMLWIADFPVWQVRTIGALEVLGVLGLNAPYVIKALPKILVPVSAAALGLTMVGAFITHATRSDPAPSLIITGVLFALCTTLAIKRFGQVKTK